MTSIYEKRLNEIINTSEGQYLILFMQYVWFELLKVKMLICVLSKFEVKTLDQTVARSLLDDGY